MITKEKKNRRHDNIDNNFSEDILIFWLSPKNEKIYSLITNTADIKRVINQYIS